MHGLVNAKFIYKNLNIPTGLIFPHIGNARLRISNISQSTTFVSFVSNVKQFLECFYLFLKSWQSGWELQNPIRFPSLSHQNTSHGKSSFPFYLFSGYSVEVLFFTDPALKCKLH